MLCLHLRIGDSLASSTVSAVCPLATCFSSARCLATFFRFIHLIRKDGRMVTRVSANARYHTCRSAALKVLITSFSTSSPEPQTAFRISAASDFASWLARSRRAEICSRPLTRQLERRFSAAATNTALPISRAKKMSPDSERYVRLRKCSLYSHRRTSHAESHTNSVQNLVANPLCFRRCSRPGGDQPCTDCADDGWSQQRRCIVVRPLCHHTSKDAGHNERNDRCKRMVAALDCFDTLHHLKLDRHVVENDRHRSCKEPHVPEGPEHRPLGKHFRRKERTILHVRLPTNESK